MLEIELSLDGRGRVEWAAIRTPDWHLVRWRSGRRELYRWQRDPWERHDLSGTDKRTATMLESRLDRPIRRSRS